MAIKPKKILILKNLSLIKGFPYDTGTVLRYSICMAYNYHGLVWEETDLIYFVPLSLVNWSLGKRK